MTMALTCPQIRFMSHFDHLTGNCWATIETPWYREVLITRELLEGRAPTDSVQYEPLEGLVSIKVANGQAKYRIVEWNERRNVARMECVEYSGWPSDEGKGDFTV